ncbi:hypothetical protein [Azospirillum doebereinerae]|uniref:Uncharacterized protein n=1 Tax=Azospirillum doebereinerae TaxID=92933 RepID=A0A3S0V2Z3_9PROT|nr:hypothetical protein [Azospirillum doebereinerae]RUQ61231.1 hypothetical protein EJ913_29935 [Azospirillum doebereinerae]
MSARKPPASITVRIGGQPVDAEARPDLGKGLYAAWVEIDGEDVARYYRLDGSGKGAVLVDVTPQVAADLAARQRRADERLEREQREGEARLRRASGETLKDARSRHGDVIEEHSDKAGVKRLRSRSPIQILHAKHWLTGRQFSAGQALHEDYMRAQMVHQPLEAGSAPDSGDGGGGCFETAALEAAARVERVRACCDQLDGRLWPVVRAVVLRERTATEVASSARSEDRRAILVSLRAGLDVTGDCYGLQSGYARTQVRVGVFWVPVELAQDFNEVQGKHGELWRSRTLNGWPWIVEARTASEVYAQARAEVDRRVTDRLGPGPHASAAMGVVLAEDRKAASNAAAQRAASARIAEDRRAKAAAAERARVVRR